jgi:hypothetical protein
MIRTILAITLSLTAATVAAQSTFLIERIDVNATRTRPDIVVAEMRLPAGHTYTTQQIEQAVYRVRRLPFVADATYTLEPGTSPEARVLRVKLVDESPVHFAFDVQGVAERSGYVTAFTQVGLRFFPARAGVLDINMGGTEYSTGGARGSTHLGDFTVQYTGYHLFGTSAYAGIGLSTHYNGRDRLVSPALLFGIPLTQTQTVRGTYSRSGYKSDNQSFATLDWMMETTDDPYFGRHGFSIAAGPRWQAFRFVADYNPPPHVLHIDTRSTSHGFGLRAEKYWPIRERSAFWARANGTLLEETDTTNGVKGSPSHLQLGDVVGGVARNFDGGRDDPDSFHRFRAELGAGYHRDHQKHGPFAEDRSGPSLFASVAYRNRVGIFRLGVTWVSSGR